MIGTRWGMVRERTRERKVLISGSHIPELGHLVHPWPRPDSPSPQPGHHVLPAAVLGGASPTTWHDSWCRPFTPHSVLLRVASSPPSHMPPRSCCRCLLVPHAGHTPEMMHPSSCCAIFLALLDVGNRLNGLWVWVCLWVGGVCGWGSFLSLTFWLGYFFFVFSRFSRCLLCYVWFLCLSMKCVVV